MKELHGTDQRTMACVNLYGVLGALEELCRLDAAAAGLVAGQRISVGFRVAGGPAATLRFEDGRCKLTEGTAGCDILLPFSSPRKFNGMIDGTITPVPVKGLTRVKFLLNEFQRLTDLLTRYLRASEEDLRDPEFFRKSTELMFYVVAAALSEIGNHDRVGRVSASNTVDGVIRLCIEGGPAVGIVVRGHRLHTVKRCPGDPMAVMEFAGFDVARGLFDGVRNAVACIGSGEVRVGGMMLMLDNINKILDRVALYLA